MARMGPSQRAAVLRSPDDAPVNLLNFLIENRNLLQEPGRGEEETFAED